MTPKRYEFRGERLTAMEIAERTGLSVAWVRMRTDAERFYERHEIEAFERDPHPSWVMLTHAGETLPLTTWVKRTGLRRNTIRGRLAQGWSVKRALTTPARKPNTYAFAGRTLTIAQWARVTGIDRQTLQGRVNTLCWPIARALTEPPLDPRTRLVRRRNRDRIARMSNAFGYAGRSSSRTGGCLGTSSHVQGTGGGRRESHLLGERP
jgi:hypothetical protein